MASETIPPVYQLHVWIRRISPMIGRRLLVPSESTLADLHDVLQSAFGWSDFHLHRFRIHGRDYGTNRVGGLGFSHEARTVRLADFQFRCNQRFLSEDDFGDG
jgi:hypothetical protein